MKILALEKPVADVTSNQIKPFLKAEAARTWELQQAGIIREIYFRQDERTAVLILECATVDEAKSFLDTLPLVREGLITFEIIPLAAYSGFARLFDKKGAFYCE